MQNSAQQEIEALLSYRSHTDYKISEKWLLGPIGTLLIGGAFLLVLFLGFFGPIDLLTFEIALAGLGIVGFVAIIATGYLVYLLVNRRNVHFAREQALFASILEIFRNKARPEDANAQASLVSNYQCYYWLAESGGERSAILQGVLAPLGWILIMFELLFLSESWKEHEKREDYMIYELNRTLSLLGAYQLPTRLRPSRIRRRDSVVYFVLSIFTLGIVELIWLYLSIEDPLEHFEFHSHLEFPLAGISSTPTSSSGAVA